MINTKDYLTLTVGDELRRLLDIGSVSGDETRLLAYLENRFRAMGLLFQRQSVVGVRHNLLVNPLPRPELVITAHVDTVPERINGCHCRREIAGERFYGRGAADVKGGIAALLGAMDKVWNGRKRDFPPVTVAFTVDEEREGRGSEELAGLGARFAVVIEPTDLRVCTAQSGSVIIHLNVGGKSAHGGEFENGDNAIFRTMEILEQFRHLPVLNCIHPLIGRGGYNLQMINGGSCEMAVPAFCDALLDFRVLPGQTPAEIQDAVDNLLNRHPGVESKWLEVSGPYEINADEAVVVLVKSCFQEALGEEPRLGGIRSWTDAENLYNSGTRPVVFGPGNLATSHTEEEYIDLPETVKAARVFAALLSHQGVMS